VPERAVVDVATRLSIAELTTATIGGHEQALMIRGRSTDLPVLLRLAGGPGGTDIGAMRLDTGLEERFVVVTWDQLFYDDTLAWARERGDAALVDRLEAMGPPPYAEPVGTYPVIVGAERALNPYPEFDGRSEISATIFRPEFSMMERIGALRGLVDS
jgi:hypothetical protein